MAGRKKINKEEQLKDDWQEIIAGERGDKQETTDAPKKEERKRPSLMLVIVVLIIASVLVISILNLGQGKGSAGQGKSQDKIWSEIKTSMDNFSQNFDALFSKLNQDKAEAANTKQLSDEELQKITAEVIKKINQEQASVKTNTDNNTTTR